MTEFPLLKDMMLETRQRDLQRFLKGRFGTLTPEVETALRAVTDQVRLDGLVDWASQCTDLDAFRARLSP